MEAKLTSVTESALGAALGLVNFASGDPATLLIHAGQGVDAARDQIMHGAFDGEDVGQAYHDLAAMALLACAAYHEMNGGS